jgi:hypothetical protein
VLLIGALLGCASSIEDLSIVFDTNVGTVATIHWTTTSPGDTRALVRRGSAVRVVEGASSEDGLSHTVVVAGLCGNEDYELSALSDTDSDSLRSAPQDIRTPAPPPSFGVFKAEAPGPDPLGGGYVLTVVDADPGGIAILDEAGCPVWWYDAPTDHFTAQARMSADGRDVLVLVAPVGASGEDAEIRRIPLAGGDVLTTAAPGAHHDFVELPDGGFAYLRADTREVDGQSVTGDAVVVAEEEGDSRVLWSVWNDRDPGDPTALPVINGTRDWTHFNGIQHDGDRFLVSSHGLGALFAVNADGGLLWQLGGDESGFTLTSGIPFAQQHGAVFVDGGVLLFDNRKTGPDDRWSRAVEYAVDEDARTWSERWSYDADRTLWSPFLGNTERLPSGRTFVGWGAAGRITEVDPDGTLTWGVDAPLGVSFGSSHQVPSLGGAP